MMSIRYDYTCYARVTCFYMHIIDQVSGCDHHAYIYIYIHIYYVLYLACMHYVGI